MEGRKRKERTGKCGEGKVEMKRGSESTSTAEEEGRVERVGGRRKKGGAGMLDQHQTASYAPARYESF